MQANTQQVFEELFKENENNICFECRKSLDNYSFFLSLQKTQPLLNGPLLTTESSFASTVLVFTEDLVLMSHLFAQ